MELALILYWYACISAIETPAPRVTVAYRCEGRKKQ